MKTHASQVLQLARQVRKSKTGTKNSGQSWTRTPKKGALLLVAVVVAASLLFPVTAFAKQDDDDFVAVTTGFSVAELTSTGFSTVEPTFEDASNLADSKFPGNNLAGVKFPGTNLTGSTTLKLGYYASDSLSNELPSTGNTTWILLAIAAGLALTGASCVIAVLRQKGCQKEQACLRHG